MTFKERLERFMAQIKQQESSGRATIQNKTSKAYGYYQFMPEVWETLWKKRGVEDANANANVPPLQWVPTPTPEAQEDLARWQFTRLFRRFGDERRVAADWRSGKGEYDPQATYVDPEDGKTKHHWTPGTMKYVNSATVPLGFEATTRETIIPDMPDDLARVKFDLALAQEENAELRNANGSLNGVASRLREDLNAALDALSAAEHARALLESKNLGLTEELRVVRQELVDTQADHDDMLATLRAFKVLLERVPDLP